MTTLTLVRWYCRVAVYKGDMLAYFGESECGTPLLECLGFPCLWLDDVPTHDVPPEFQRDRNGWWSPPASLKTLEGQFAAYQNRLKQERISRLEQELASLRAPDLGMTKIHT